MKDNESLVFYYNSKDIDVEMARYLIDELEGEGVKLNNSQKNTIMSYVKSIYSSGAYQGQKRVSENLLQMSKERDNRLSDRMLEYLELYGYGYFEDSKACERSKGRISKDEYYLGIAEAVLARSTCIRRRYGAVLVKNDIVIGTGYNGSPRGEENCIDKGYCDREKLNIPKGERYELCVSVHAEQNALLSADRAAKIGSTLYIVGREVSTWEYANPEPCMMCRRVIKNDGIARVVGMYKGGVVELSI